LNFYTCKCGTARGRAYLYGLMACGRPGADRAITILTEQVVRTMKLLQVTASPSWDHDMSPNSNTSRRR
jgi:hypothetical protein